MPHSFISHSKFQNALGVSYTFFGEITNDRNDIEKDSPKQWSSPKN